MLAILGCFRLFLGCNVQDSNGYVVSKEKIVEWLCWYQR